MDVTPRSSASAPPSDSPARQATLPHRVVNAGGAVLRRIWASPATALGLLLVAPACAAGATARRVGGVLEVAGGRMLPRAFGIAGGGRFVALTLGHVVLGTSHATLARYRTHEHEHVRQYERWGAVFFAAYAASSALAWLQGRDAYWHNGFERKARAAAVDADVGSVDPNR